MGWVVVSQTGQPTAQGFCSDPWGLFFFRACLRTTMVQLSLYWHRRGGCQNPVPEKCQATASIQFQDLEEETAYESLFLEKLQLFLSDPKAHFVVQAHHARWGSTEVPWHNLDLNRIHRRKIEIPRFPGSQEHCWRVQKQEGTAPCNPGTPEPAVGSQSWINFG